MCFWHGHLRLLGHDANTRALTDAHAATHDHAIHESDVGFGVSVNQMIQCVFFSEEVTQAAVTCQCSLMKKTDVTAGTKMSERAFLAMSPDQHGQHLAVVLVIKQCRREQTHHVKRERIQSLGSIQCDATYSANHFLNNQDVRTHCCTVHVAIRHCVASIQTIHCQTRQQ